MPLYVDGYKIIDWLLSRCFFGSDWPVCRLNSTGADYAEVIQLLKDILARKEESTLKKIFQTNVIDFYKIGDVVNLG